MPFTQCLLFPTGEKCGLARLIAKASERTQVWLVTHSERLAAALEKHGGVAPRTVIKKDGETWIEGLKTIGRFDDED
jgi:predicted ATPase